MENKRRTIVLLWKELGFSVCIEQNGQLVVFCKIIGVFCETVYWLKPNTFFFLFVLKYFQRNFQYERSNLEFLILMSKHKKILRQNNSRMVGLETSGRYLQMFIRLTSSASGS